MDKSGLRRLKSDDNDDAHFGIVLACVGDMMALGKFDVVKNVFVELHKHVLLKDRKTNKRWWQGALLGKGPWGTWGHDLHVGGQGVLR